MKLSKILKLRCRANIVEEIQTRNGFSKKKSAETVETLLEIMKETLESGDNVLISGFGKFCIKNKKERREGIRLLVRK